MNISSVIGRVSGRGYLAYGTAKAALAHWTRLVSQDLGPLIRVNAIAVGSIMTSRPGVRRQRRGDDDRARREDHACSGSVRSRTSRPPWSTWPARPAAFLTGKVVEVDGGLDSPTSTSACPTWRPHR